ncbi:MAG: hypothetical protein KDD62_09025, partial [Bdellovibrionales bacterium]|nr:hypothetical protein [Bdellovibrionales bacterium]
MSILTANNNGPSRLQNNSLWTEPRFQIGNTDCYNIGACGSRHAQAMQDVISLAKNCHPHFVRLIGSVPSEKIHAQVERALIDTFSTTQVGMILAACTHTTSST